MLEGERGGGAVRLPIHLSSLHILLALRRCSWLVQVTSRTCVSYALDKLRKSDKSCQDIRAVIDHHSIRHTPNSTWKHAARFSRYVCEHTPDTSDRRQRCKQPQG